MLNSKKQKSNRLLRKIDIKKGSQDFLAGLFAFLTGSIKFLEKPSAPSRHRQRVPKAFEHKIGQQPRPTNMDNQRGHKTPKQPSRLDEREKDIDARKRWKVHRRKDGRFRCRPLEEATLAAPEPTKPYGPRRCGGPELSVGGIRGWIEHASAYRFSVKHAQTSPLPSCQSSVTKKNRISTNCLNIQ